MDSVRSWFRRSKNVSTDRSILDSLSRKLDEVEQKVPMLHSYERVDPYIIESAQPGIDIRFIVYHIESKLWFDQHYVDAMLEFSNRFDLVREGGTVFDLGCNSGFLTAWFAKRVGPNGQVVAFDPFPWNTAATYHTALLNGCTNVQCETVGVASKRNTITIPYTDSKIYAGQSDQHTFEAKLVPLDDYKHLRPDYIKVDIEGAERELLAGASEIIRQSPSAYWAIEMHNEFIQAAGSDPEQIPRDFLKNGYDVRMYYPDGTRYTDLTPGSYPQKGHAMFASRA
jgi:FkbM family methyltransferase